MAGLFPYPKFRAVTDTGILPGAKLYVYLAGTTTQTPSYTDRDQGTPNSNPVICDANGEANVWLPAGSFKLKLDDANDVTIFNVDKIAGSDGNLWIQSGSDIYYNAGNVFIGTTTGTETLTVVGDVSISSTLDVVSDLTVSAGDIKILDNTKKIFLGTGQVGEIFGNALTLTVKAPSNIDLELLSTGTGNVNIRTEQNIIFYEDSNEIMRITDDGRVGIGSSSPSVPFQVTDGEGTLPSLSATTTMLIQNNDDTTDNSEVSIISGATGNSKINFGDANGESPGFIDYDNNVNSLGLGVNGGVRVFIDSDGDVGIGTTSPDVLANGSTFTTLSIIETMSDRRGAIELGDNQNVDGGGIGDINFVGPYQDASHKFMAGIRANSSGTTSGQRGGELKFFVKTDAIATAFQALTIDSLGDVEVKVGDLIVTDGNITIPSNTKKILLGAAGTSEIYSTATDLTIDAPQNVNLNLLSTGSGFVNIQSPGSIFMGTTALIMDGGSAEITKIEMTHDGDVGNGATISYQGDNLSINSLETGGDITFVSGGAGAMFLSSDQNLGLGSTPGANTILDISSTTKGFKPPSMTTTQRDIISGALEGMVIYNNTTKVLNFHNGTVWGAV